jgi:oligopeptide transport system permease protein
MWRLLASRLLQAIPVLLVIATVTFFLIRVAPGGPFASEKSVSPEVLDALNARYGLDDPLLKQFLDYLGNIIRGDFGPSFKYPNRSVNELIWTGLPITAELGCYALLIALAMGFAAGLAAALRPRTPQDYVAMSLATLGICLPAFLLGPLLVMVFGFWLEWLPVSGWGYAWGDKILPSVTLGAAYAAYLARLVRGGMLEVLAQDFIRTARANGLSEYRIVLRHAMPGALSPSIAFLGPAIAGLLSGSFVVETIFQIPGLGRFYVQAAFNRDYTMIMGATLFFAVLIVACNFLSDLALAAIDPRLRRRVGGTRT